MTTYLEFHDMTMKGKKMEGISVHIYLSKNKIWNKKIYGTCNNELIMELIENIYGVLEYTDAILLWLKDSICPNTIALPGGSRIPMGHVEKICTRRLH